jgi:hypothetical protein
MCAAHVSIGCRTDARWDCYCWALWVQMILDCCLNNGSCHNATCCVLPNACKLSTVLHFFFFLHLNIYVLCVSQCSVACISFKELHHHVSLIMLACMLLLLGCVRYSTIVSYDCRQCHVTLNGCYNPWSRTHFCYLYNT